MPTVSLSYLSAMRFTGVDAAEFLHNQLSADIRGLTDGQSTLACYCEPKGRVLALMLVNRQADDFVVIMAKSLIETIAKRLQMYVIRAKVQIEVLDSVTVAGVFADESLDDGMEILASATLPGTAQSLALINSENLADTEHKSPDMEAQENWKHQELKQDICWLGADTSGEFLPQMLGFDSIGAVNFKKGCYPGQEIVARTHYLGKVKRHPRLLCSDQLIGPNPMEKIEITAADESFDAIVVDHAYSEDLGNCLLVVTRMEPEQAATGIEYQGQSVNLI